LIDALPDLRVVARCGVGLDNVDVQAAAERGIVVVYAPGSTTTAVAEHTLLLMLALARRLLPTANAVCSQQWAVRNGYQGMELAGKTLGIIGMGMIGQRVAQLASALGMAVIYWNRSASPGPGQAVSLDELLRQADVLSVHVALSPETRHLIGARQLAQMKPGALLINTARGAIVDQAAVAQALATGHLGGFAADVLDVEPPAADEPLLSQANALLTPHIAALTTDTYRLMCVYTVTNVLAILRGEQPAPESVYQ
jgi:phosphoglycerate dehydrogenase-like enzyme